ncbi:MAG: hypothetical protein C4297_01085 [Gemmataceae bacterium]
MSDTNATISTIIPVYNGEKYLAEAIESVLKQTYPPIEVIVVDDGSTDRSAEIADSFGPPVQVVRQENRGESAARNTGIERASGDYIHFLDADDLMHPQAYEVFLSHLAGKPRAVGLMGLAVFTDSPQRPIRVYRARHNCFYPALCSGNIGAPLAWLTPMPLVRETGGFDEQIRYSEDWDFWARVGLRDPVLVPIDFIGAYYRVHAKSQSHEAVFGRRLQRSLDKAHLMRKIILGLLQKPHLLAVSHTAAFWGAWTALHTSRKLGASWRDLAALVAAMDALVHACPELRKHSLFARACNIFGTRCAETIRSWFVSDNVEESLESEREQAKQYVNQSN